MDSEPEPVLSIALAIADLSSVEWESAMASSSDARVRSAIGQLRLVESLLSVHWNLQSSPDVDGVDSAEQRDLPAERWGHLRITRRIGKGAFGEVFRAWDTQLEREVALKLLPERDAADDDVASSIIEEGRLLARVDHHNVVTIHGADCHDDRVGLWMELIDGQNLADTLWEQGPFGAREAASIGMDLCRALAAVHAAGIIHGDLKARNVMRAVGGRIVLMDFGLAYRSAGVDERHGISVAGTPLYMAPELFQNKAPTVRSDVYGLGVLLYHLVSCAFPVEPETLLELREAHARHEIKRLRDVRPDLPVSFIRVLETALAHAPNRRFRTAGEMEAALGSAVSGTTTAVAIPVAPVAGEEKAGFRLRLKLGPVTISFTATVAALILAVLLSNPPPSPDALHPSGTVGKPGPGTGTLMAPRGPPTVRQTRKKALLIAVQSYDLAKQGWRALRGPLNDAKLIRTVLVNRFGFQDSEDAFIEVLDSGATRQGITDGFEALIERTRPGDLVYIHYSGHGSRVPNANGDDEGPQDMDSTWVPFDVDESFQILDDEIALWLAQLRAITSDVVFVVDACHSGTITRSDYSLQPRGVKFEDTRDYSWSQELLSELEAIEAGLSAAATDDRFIRISASEDDQEAFEDQAPDGEIYGLLSWYWARALSGARPNATYRQVFLTMRAEIYAERYKQQTPVSEGALDAGLFDSDFEDPRRGLTVRSIPGPKQVTFDGGVLAGVAPGSLYERAQSTNQGPPVRARIRDVTATTSTGDLLGDGQVDGHDLFIEVERAYPFPAVKVAILADDGVATEWISAFQEALGDKGGLRLVANETPDLIVRLARHVAGSVENPRQRFCDDAVRGTDSVWACLLDGTEGAFGAEMFEGRSLRFRLTDIENVQTVEQGIEKILHNLSILSFAGAHGARLPEAAVEVIEVLDPAGAAGKDRVLAWKRQGCSPDSVDVAAVSLGTTGRPALQLTAKNGRFLAFRAVNDTARALYYYLVNIRPDGGTAVLYPMHGGTQDRVGPGEIRCLKVIRLVDPQLTDTYVTFLSDSPAWIWNLEQGPLHSGDSSLDQLLGAVGRPDTWGESQTHRSDAQLAARTIRIEVEP